MSEESSGSTTPAAGDRARYGALVRELGEHDRRYYVELAPTIPDVEYDRLYRELRDLEAAHPDWIDPNSPTQRVAPMPISAFPKVVRDGADAVARQHLQPRPSCGRSTTA